MAKDKRLEIRVTEATIQQLDQINEYYAEFSNLEFSRSNQIVRLIAKEYQFIQKEREKTPL